MNSSAEQPVDVAVSPLDAFTGPITRNQPGPLYTAGLAIVACAMVLLPLIYIGLIASAATLVFVHLYFDTWILFDSSGGRIGLLNVIVYLGPAVAGGILVFFMVKPFFAAKAKAPTPITLEPASEPRLFSFVQKICALVGAPVPCRIDVDCQVNASASLRKGLTSRNLVLTIGLPLVSGLDMREFAGVLAHEFGHFAQGAGMRLTYIIRKVNFWFARVVYERDSWDVRLENDARTADWRIAIVLQFAQGGIFVSRRLLWVLMHAGHAISCFMLRQMEYDADSYEAKVAGSDAFASTVTRLRFLNAATQAAYQDLRQSWTNGRLPENLPLLIQHKAGALPDDVQQKLSGSAFDEKTRWFHTHPCDADRVQAVKRLHQPGVFHLTHPAVDLFSDFSALSKRVTRHQYEKHLSLQVAETNLIPVEEILRESAASSEADALVRKYFGSVDATLAPLLVSAEVTAVQDDHLVLAGWREARQLTESLRPAAEQLSKECIALQQRRSALMAAYLLTKAGFNIQPAEFGLPENANSPSEQCAAACAVLERQADALSGQLQKLAPFRDALHRRITFALQAAFRNPGPKELDREQDPVRIIELAGAVGSQMWRAHEIGARLTPSLILFRQREARPDDVHEVLDQLLAELRNHTASIWQALEGYTYPFPDARGRLTVAEYARSEQKGDNEWHTAYLDGSAHVEHLFSLHYRLLGKVLAYADAADKRLEKEADSGLSLAAAQAQ